MKLATIMWSCMRVWLVWAGFWPPEYQLRPLGTKRCRLDALVQWYLAPRSGARPDHHVQHVEFRPASGLAPCCCVACCRLLELGVHP